MAFFEGAGNETCPVSEYDCAVYGDPSTNCYSCCGKPGASYYLAWTLALMQLPLAYAPQWIKMWKGKTHIGISLPNNIAFSLDGLFLLLSLLCQTWEEVFGCCGTDHGNYQCGYAIASFLFVLAAWMGSTFNVVLYFKVFDVPGLEAKGFDPKEEWASCVRQAWFLVLVHVVVIVIPLILAIAGGAVYADGVHKFGLVMSICASFLVASHWLLQMYETWRMQEIGGLSMTMMVVSIFGSLFTIYTYSDKGFAVLAPYLAGAISIFIATVWAFWVDWRAKKGMAKEGDGHGLPQLDPVNIVGSFQKRASERRRSSMESGGEQELNATLTARVSKGTPANGGEQELNATLTARVNKGAPAS